MCPRGRQNRGSLNKKPVKKDRNSHRLRAITKPSQTRLPPPHSQPPQAPMSPQRQAAESPDTTLAHVPHRGLGHSRLLQFLGIVVQAALSRQTRGDVHEQAGWMKEQTGRMSRQADLMNRQNVFARESIAATRNAADAAKLSAESTLGQFQAMKAKERARVG